MTTAATPTTGAAPRWLLNIFRANLVAQVGIVVTGGLVRLTGSGLGCPTWPECVDGSLVPTSRQEESWHKLVEFGNRTLTFLLAALAIAAVVGALVQRRQFRSAGAPARRPILLLSAIPLLGTVAQALLGGITVLTGLHPAVVAAHFLLSIAIIGGTAVLVERAQDAADRPVTPLVRTELRRMAEVLVVLALVIVVMGTVVTGSGPNSGDADVSHRFGIDQRVSAWIHADTVFLFVGLLAGMVLALHLVTAPARALRRAWILVALTVANAAVGYLQLFTGLPWLAVALHMLLACMTWVAVIRLRLALTRRGEDPAGAAVRIPDKEAAASR